MEGGPAADQGPVVEACRSVLATMDAGARLLVGYSGGLDSTVLLHALTCLDDCAERRIEAVHVNHGLEPACEAWQAHCEAFAATLGLPCHSARLTIEPGSNLEARARDGRYAAFAALLEDGDCLLLAHHQQDRTETVLLHLLQGRGLFGLPSRRPVGRGLLLRPLLEVPRAALLEHAVTHGLDWIEDASNSNMTHDRAFLRHQVLPALRSRFDNLDSRLGRVVQSTAARAGLLSRLLDLDRTALPVSLLTDLARDEQLTVLREWLVGHNVGGAMSDAALLSLLERLPTDPAAQIASGVAVIRRLGGELHLTPPPPELAGEYSLPMPGTLVLPHGVLVSEVVAGGGSHHFHHFHHFHHRNGALGVSFLARLPGSQKLRHGGRLREVRELLREAGVPAWQRPHYPLLLDGSGLLAVPGIAARDPLSGAAGARFVVSWSAADTFSR